MTHHAQGVLLIRRVADGGGLVQVDGRVEGLLEQLNAASSDVNQFETELMAARKHYLHVRAPLRPSPPRLHPSAHSARSAVVQSLPQPYAPFSTGLDEICACTGSDGLAGGAADFEGRASWIRPLVWRVSASPGDLLAPVGLAPRSTRRLSPREPHPGKNHTFSPPGKIIPQRDGV